MGPSMRRTAYPDNDDVQRDYARHDALERPDLLGPFVRGDIRIRSCLDRIRRNQTGGEEGELDYRHGGPIALENV